MRGTRRLLTFGVVVVSALLLLTTLRPYVAEKFDVIKQDVVLEACTKHPVSCRVDRAEQLFHEFEARQSKTVPDAVKEYRKRYRRDPPPGFKGWVQFALDNNSTVIDDYDQLEADLAPLRAMDPELLYSRMGVATMLFDQIDLGVLSIKNHTVKITGPPNGGISTTTLYRVLEPISHLLPDVIVLFNWYSEPRVLDTSSHTTTNTYNAMFDKLRKGKDKQTNREPLHVYEESGHDTLSWQNKTCPSYHLSKSQGWKHLDPPLNVCAEDPDELRKLHGFFQGPDAFKPFDQLVPMLSRGKVSTFGDILIPNPCYYNEIYRGAAEDFGPVIPDPFPFELKHNSLYWRGSTTGLKQSTTNWGGGHRHRAMRYFKQLREAAEKLAGRPELDPMEVAAGLNDTVPTRKSMDVPSNTLPPFDYTDPDVTRAVKRLGAEAFEVVFSRYVNAAPEIQQAMSPHVPAFGSKPNHEVYKHKYVLDLDGQSMSCRFYHLLGSNSLVFKQTIWTEWHDDRLVPWLHYVPIDIAIENNQLPLLLDYFVHTADGQTEAIRIANAGAQWAAKTLRQIDVTIYYYRALLEFATLLP